MHKYTTPNKQLNLLRKLVTDFLKNYQVKIYLYGSRAKNTARPTSDVDVAILPSSPLPIGMLAKLHERLEESTIPYTVDLVDLSQTDNNFRKKILAEGILWNDKNSV
jgi:uncharacterized protein